MNLPLALTPVIDLVMLFTALEALALWAYHRRTSRGLAPRDFAANMVAGLCLMLALRCGVQGAGAPSVLLWLLAAGAAHGTDILMRLRQREVAA